MRVGILKWRFTCVNHITCGWSDNTEVHFLSPTSQARWPTRHLISVGSLYVKVPKSINKYKTFINLNQNARRRNKKCIGKKVTLTPIKNTVKCILPNVSEYENPVIFDIQ